MVDRRARDSTGAAGDLSARHQRQHRHVVHERRGRHRRPERLSTVCRPIDGGLRRHRKGRPLWRDTSGKSVDVFMQRRAVTSSMGLRTCPPPGRSSRPPTSRRRQAAFSGATPAAICDVFMNGATIGRPGASAICPPPVAGRHRRLQRRRPVRPAVAHNQRHTVIWLMNGATVSSSASSAPCPRLVGVQTGDYNATARAIFSGATPAGNTRCVHERHGSRGVRGARQLPPSGRPIVTRSDAAERPDPRINSRADDRSAAAVGMIWRMTAAASVIKRQKDMSRRRQLSSKAAMAAPLNAAAIRQWSVWAVQCELHAVASV